MKSSWLAGLIILAVAAVASSPEPQEGDIKKLFKDAEAIKKSARKLSKEGRDRVEKALDGKIDDADANATFWEFRALVPEAHPSEKVRVLYTVVTAKGAKGDIKLGVAIAPEERVVGGVVILDNKDEPTANNHEFLDQFTRFIYGPSLANPAKDLEAARAKGKKREDAAGKQIDGVFKLHTAMHPVGVAWDTLEGQMDKEDVKGSEQADQLAILFADSKKALADLTFLSGMSNTNFGRRLDESVTRSQQLSKLIKAKDWSGARTTFSELEKQGCSQCHAGTQRIFRDKRTELGVGNGYFAVGFDVYAPPGPKAAFEAMALAVRRATLILSEAK